MSMTKRDLAVRIAGETGITQQNVAKVIQMVLDGLTEELSNGGGIELRNFGVFEVAVRESRKGRNPNKPEDEVIIPRHCVVKFRPGKELRAKAEAISPKKLIK